MDNSAITPGTDALPVAPGDPAARNMYVSLAIGGPGTYDGVTVPEGLVLATFTGGEHESRGLVPAAEYDQHARPRLSDYPRFYRIPADLAPAEAGHACPAAPPTTQQQAGIEHVLAAVAGTVFTSAAGETIILLCDDPYAVSVDRDGDTASAYLVTVPPAEIAEAMDADEAEIGGWSTGWTC